MGDIDCSIQHEQSLKAKDQQVSMNSSYIQEMNALHMRQDKLRAKQNILYMKQKQQVHSAIMKNAANALQLWKNIGLMETKCLAEPSLIKPTVILQQQRDLFATLKPKDPSFISA
eukprot:CAMPEP_0195526472 /NCGR_PEP_ID=MMETSP0794_2-20130614/27558_1 /TAXON_ID=515487 /ORGANISM="Stephanopyxis turris, Strain CCMP 815" /LENGTH=114 /DNA_ID=CAMNT_0040657161 /DNA_START=222 /DNA_END=562 /DNA_ORIENTATION=-